MIIFKGIGNLNSGISNSMVRVIFDVDIFVKFS